MKAGNTTTILGVDPALGTTGYGVIRCCNAKVRLVDGGVIRVSREGAIETRLKELFDGLMEVISDHKPDCFALEQLYSHYERPTTAILMGHARGVICLAAAQSNICVTSYAPTKVKKLLTGNGRAPKGQMQLAVQKQLQLSKPLDPPDVADALAIALCHAQALRFPHSTLGDLKLGPTQRAIMAQIEQMDALRTKVPKPG